MKHKSKNRNKLWRAAMICTAVMALAGCAKDEIIPGPGAGGAEQTSVQFSIRVPGNSLPVTRFMDDDRQKEIVSVDIFAFDGDDFLYHIPVDETQIDSEGKFTVTLPTSDAPISVRFLANSAGIIASVYSAGEISSSDNYDAIRKKLVKSSEKQWLALEADYEPFPI
ncbi:MAG: hypothetical protein LIO77_09100, partial [Rikenellaceae bacterium]|nr:hypothetical protein [Rikenellaceae bacterium]